MDLLTNELTELTPEESARIDGGDYFKAALMVVGAFGAGFKWGYEVLGPRLFG